MCAALFSKFGKFSQRLCCLKQSTHAREIYVMYLLPEWRIKKGKKYNIINRPGVAGAMIQPFSPNLVV